MSFYRLYFKRIIDFVVASVGLIILSPLFLILWIWLSIANKGAGAFFVQERPGMERRYLGAYVLNWCTFRHNIFHSLL